MYDIISINDLLVEVLQEITILYSQIYNIIYLYVINKIFEQIKFNIIKQNIYFIINLYDIISINDLLVEVLQEITILHSQIYNIIYLYVINKIFEQIKFNIIKQNIYFLFYI